MAAPSQGTDEVDVLIVADDAEHVRTIREAMSRTFAPPLRALHPSELGQVLLAGSLSLRLLVNGIIDWKLKLGGVLLVAEWDAEERRWKLRREGAKKAQGLLIVRPDGSTDGPYTLSPGAADDIVSAAKSVMSGSK